MIRECLIVNLLKTAHLFLTFLVITLVIAGCKSPESKNTERPEAKLQTLHPVLKGGQWGLINSAGKVVVSPSFKKLSDPLALVQSKVISTDVYEELPSSVRVKAVGNLSELDQRKLEVLQGIKKSYNYNNDSLLFSRLQSPFPVFSTQLTRIAVAENPTSAIYKIGYINQVGSVIIKPQYDLGSVFTFGMALVYEGNRAYFIDIEGKTLEKHSNYDALMPFSDDGLAAVKKDNKWGFINVYGDLVIQPQFEGASTFSNGYSVVSSEDGVGAIDTKGNIVIPMSYYYLKDFGDGLFPIYIEDKSDAYWGYISADNQLAFETKFDDAHPFIEGVAIVRIGREYFLINPLGEYVTPSGFEDITDISEGLAAVKLNDQWGYVDINTGKMAIALNYDWAFGFIDGIAQVVVDGKVGYINKSGRYVWEPTQ